MNDFIILIPVLHRPHRVSLLMESHRSSFLSQKQASEKTQLLFLAQEGDKEEISELRRCEANYIVLDSNRTRWSHKINDAVNRYVASFYWFAADDLAFRPDWYGIWHRWMTSKFSSIDGNILNCVIGSSDGTNPATVGGTTTHPIVSRKYIESVGSKPLHEGYHHNFVDTEFVAIAQKQEKYVHIPAVLAEHLHPVWGKSPIDDTYRLGSRHFEQDKALFNSRRAMGGW